MDHVAPPYMAGACAFVPSLTGDGTPLKDGALVPCLGMTFQLLQYVSFVLALQYSVSLDEKE